jgi:hypothetical protein
MTVTRRNTVRNSIRSGLWEKEKMGVIRVYVPQKVTRDWRGGIVPSGRCVYVPCEPNLYETLIALWDKYGVLEAGIPALLHKRKSNANTNT